MNNAIADDGWLEILDYFTLYDRLGVFSKVSKPLSSIAIPPPGSRSFDLFLLMEMGKMEKLWNSQTSVRCLKEYKFGSSIEEIVLSYPDVRKPRNRDVFGGFGIRGKEKKKKLKPDSKEISTLLFDAFSTNFPNVKSLRLKIFDTRRCKLGDSLLSFLDSFPKLESLETNLSITAGNPITHPRLDSMTCLCQNGKLLENILPQLKVLETGLINENLDVIGKLFTKPNRLVKLDIGVREEVALNLPKSLEHFHLQELGYHAHNKNLVEFARKNQHIVSENSPLKIIKLRGVGKSRTEEFPNSSEYMQLSFFKNLDSLSLKGLGMEEFLSLQFSKDHNESSIKCLSLKTNFLSSKKGEVFQALKERFPNMTRLDLSHNEFVLPLPDLSTFIAHPLNMKSLNLKLCSLDNPLQYTYNREEKKATPTNQIAPWLSNFENLEELNVSETGLTGFPDSLKKLSELTFLDISENDIFDTIPIDFGNLYPQIRVLKMSGVRNTFIPESFSMLKGLRILDISWNKLNELPSSFGRVMMNLESFRGHCNPWKNMPLSIFFNDDLMKKKTVSSSSIVRRMCRQIGTFLVHRSAPPLPCCFENPKEFRARERLKLEMEVVGSRKKERNRMWWYRHKNREYPLYATRCFQVIPLCEEDEEKKVMNEMASRITYLRNSFERGNSWYGSSSWSPPSEKRDRIKDRGISYYSESRVGGYILGDVSDECVSELSLKTKGKRREEEKKEEEEKLEGCREVLFKYSRYGVHSSGWNGRGREFMLGTNVLVDMKTKCMKKWSELEVGVNHEPK